jgi:hypothetical protein
MLRLRIYISKEERKKRAKKRKKKANLKGGCG